MEDNDKYYKSRRFQRLLLQYEKALSEGQTPYLEADELTDIAEYYMTGKQCDKATEAIETALAMHPDSVDPQVFLARQKMFFGELDEAYRIVDAITDQQDPEVVYLKAELLIKEGRTDDASNYLLSMSGQLTEQTDSFLYDCTLIFMDYDQWQMADQWCDLLAKKSPNHPNLPIIMAEIDMGLDRYEEAISRLESILDNDPYNIQAWNFLAESRGAIGLSEEAIDAADFALAIQPDNARAQVQKAHCLLVLGRHEEASDILFNLLQRQPNDIEALILYGHCLICLQRYEEALKILEKGEKDAMASAENPNDMAQIYLQQAFAYSQQGQINLSIERLNLARNIPYKDAWEYDMLEAEIYLDNHLPDKAEQRFAKAVQNSPDRLNTLFSVGVTYGVSGDYETAISILIDVWQVCGEEEGAFVTPYLALNLYKSGQTERFLSTLRLAVEKDIETTESLFREIFPGIRPEDYYRHAFHEAYGIYPD